MFGLMPLDQVAAETKSGDLVYIHFHDHEPGEGAIDSILHTVIVNRGETYGPRPTEVAVSERTEDNITLVVTGWKDAEGNVYSETSPVQT
jgi:Icc-related predicted phosphoesterase